MGHISRIRLVNFRNYDELDLKPGPGVSIFSGKNGQGKSNFLESVYFLSLLRSFRSKQVQNLKKWGESGFMISANIDVGIGLPLDMRISYADKRELYKNGGAVYRSSDFIRYINAVAFVPEDIQLVKGTAGIRRQFMDIILSQLYPVYMSGLQLYNRALKNRNSIIRKAKSKSDLDKTVLKSFDGEMVKWGTAISEYRAFWINSFREKVDHFTEMMFPEGSKLEVLYDCSLNMPEITEEAYFSSLDRNFDRDYHRRQTHIGPHRDELIINLNGKLLNSFGSEGQCRLASLVLKMAAAEMMIENDDLDNVVLLIDDVIGELDEARKDAFLQTVSRGDQVFLACTEVPEYFKDKEYQGYRVNSGSVKRIK